MLLAHGSGFLDGLQQEFPTTALKVQFPAEFSFDPDQTPLPVNNVRPVENPWSTLLIITFPKEDFAEVHRITIFDIRKNHSANV